MKWFVIILCILLSACGQIKQGKVVNVYKRYKLGAGGITSEWFTLVELPDGTRQTLKGKQGKVGEQIKFY